MSKRNRFQMQKPSKSDSQEQEIAALRQRNADLEAMLIYATGGSKAVLSDNARLRQSSNNRIALERVSEFNKQFGELAALANSLNMLADFVMVLGRTKPTKKLLEDLRNDIAALEENLSYLVEQAGQGGYQIDPQEKQRIETAQRESILRRQAIDLFLRGKKPHEQLRQIAEMRGETYAARFSEIVEAVTTPGPQPDENYAASRLALLTEVHRRQTEDGRGREAVFNDYMIELDDKGSARSDTENEIYEMMKPYDPQWPVVEKWFTRHWNDGQDNLSVKTLSD